MSGLRCFTFGEGKRSNVTRAQAYNAAAKGLLEGSFKILEEMLIALLPGYLGGNRMNSRRANLGKAPAPWPGTFDMFVERVEGLIAYWMTRVRESGDLKGSSPQDAYTRFVENGWERTDVDSYAFMVAFSIEDTRKVVDGKISAPGGKWYCDELVAYTGQRVRVRLPKYTHWNGIPVYTLKDNGLIGVARLDWAVERNDPAGAVEASRRKSVARAAIADKAASVDTIDVPALMIASAKRQEPPPVPKSAGKVQLAHADAEAGRQIAETPRERQDREHREKVSRHRQRVELARQFLGRRGS